MGLLQLSLESHTEAIPWYERFDPEQRLIRDTGYFRLKRTLDLLLCVVGLPFFVPAFIACAILVKLDSLNEPVLLREQRAGRGGRQFWMHRFRTTTLETSGPHVTRIGRILRKAGLNELPQIINVIEGKMSFVGPRPTILSPDTYLLWQTERLDVMPGITGLAQVVSRDETAFDERARLDITYIERQSIWLDVNILAHAAVLALRKGWQTEGNTLFGGVVRDDELSPSSKPVMSSRSTSLPAIASERVPEQSTVP